MKKNQIALAGVAFAFVLGGAGAAFAQNVDPMQPGNAYHKFKKPIYRPLKVTPKPMAPAPVAAPGYALGNALATPFNAVGAVGGPIGIAGSVGAGAVSGATTLALSPLAGLTGGGVGISPVAAPPLPIVARYAGTGKVTTTYDEGYAQDVPVDSSGPIYKINYKESGERTVTPFSLLAFPVTGVTSAITTPFH